MALASMAGGTTVQQYHPVLPAENPSGQPEGQSKLTVHHPSSTLLQASSLDGSVCLQTLSSPQREIRSVTLASTYKEMC